MSSEGPVPDVHSDDDEHRNLVVVRAVHETAVLGTWSLPAGDHLIGRAEGAAVHIPLPQISRQHATLTVSSSGTITITDHGSSSGTRISGEVIKSSGDLEPSTVIQVADVALEIVRSHENDATLPATPPPVSERETRRDDAAAGNADLTSLTRRRLATAEDVAAGSGAITRDVNLERPAELRRSGPSDEEQKSFLLETRLLARLEHPNIPPLHQLGKDAEGRLFRTVKQPSPQTLESRLEQFAAGKAMELEARLGVFEKIGDAVAFAHDKGVIHGRLHPARIQLGDHGEVLVGGWEYAQELSSDAANEDETGAVGSFRALDSELSPGSDMFSLGALLHCLLRGLTAQTFDPSSLPRSAPRGSFGSFCCSDCATRSSPPPG